MKTQGHKGQQGRQGRQAGRGAASGILLSLLFLTSLVSLPAPARGLEPYLVKDINPVPEPADSFPKSFVTLGSVALFEASDELTGTELWRSDGTKAGTWQIADVCHSYVCNGLFEGFALTNRHYFFSFLDEDSNWLLWATDGTPTGTFQLTDPSVYASGPLISVGDVLYFDASVGDGEDSVYEMWRSDGTPAGTWRVSDQSPYSMVAFKGSLYFTGDDGALWKTDGTPAGTVKVASFPGHRIASWLFVLGSRLVLGVNSYTPDPRAELWSSDGTAEGTQALFGARWFPYSSAVGGRLYFVAEDDRDGQELWVTDGTPQNTRELTHLDRWDAFYSQAQGYFLELPRAAAGNRFVFLANDGPHGIEPWVTDGTVKGTRLLKDFCPGACYGKTQVWDRALPGRVFLTVTRKSRGNELWVTDGTEAGTRLVRDICPGKCSGHPHAPFVVKNRLLFAADDGVDGDELWATDGREANTIRISDFAPELPWDDDIEGTVVGGQLLFDAPGPEGYELWRADGTGPSGTRLVRDIDTADVGGSYPADLMALGDEALFFTFPLDSLPDFTLWKSDGTDAGTVQVRVFHPEDTDGPLHDGPVSAQAAGQLFFFLLSPNPESSSPVPWRTDGTEAGTYPLLGEDVRVDWNHPEMRAARNAIFFAAEDTDHGRELWASDGTVAGTRLVRDVEPGTSGSEPAGLTDFQGQLYFSASNEALGRELWRSDGTEAGTGLVKDIRPGSGSDPSLLTAHAGRLWFFADDGEHGRELWASNGTVGGTALAVDVEPGADSFEPSSLVSLANRFGDRLVFSGQSPSQGSGIWVTDGTAAGTRRISRQDMNEHAVFQGRVWFGSDDVGSEFLWVTDGTEAGTVRVLDRDGRPIPDPEQFAVLGGRLLVKTRFSLWETDGTQAGTFLLAANRPVFEVDGNLARAGSHVFFPAFSPETGNELWAVEAGHP
jgi:ELWxxDGT repeat protein